MAPSRITSIDPRPDRAITVAVVVTSDVPLLHLSIPGEVFGADRTAAGVPAHRVVMVAAEPGPIVSDGIMLMAEHGLEALERADLVLVPWARIDDEPPPALLAALIRAHERGAVVAGMCGGSFVLAAAGLLEGRSATTHWLHLDELAWRFPRLRVDRHSIFVDAGGVLTCAGTTAGIDLCLHLLRRFNGAEVADVVARRMVAVPRLGVQSQTPWPLVGGELQANPIAVTVEWALRHLGDGIGVDDLVAHACMSRRHFHRRFRDTTGVSPHQWLVARRVQLAERLLETTDITVEAIAHRAGFGSPLAFRTQFMRAHGMPPRDYRASFRTLPPPVDGAGLSTSSTGLSVWPESVA